MPKFIILICALLVQCSPKPSHRKDCLLSPEGQLWIVDRRAGGRYYCRVWQEEDGWGAELSVEGNYFSNQGFMLWHCPANNP